MADRPTTLRNEAVERMARAMRARDRGGDEWGGIPDSDKVVWRVLAREALDVLLTLLAERGCRVVGPRLDTPGRIMVMQALEEHEWYGFTGEDMQTFYSAALAAAPNPLAEDPAHG